MYQQAPCPNLARVCQGKNIKAIVEVTKDRKILHINIFG